MATAYDTIDFAPTPNIPALQTHDVYPGYEISKDQLILQLQKENNGLAIQLAQYKNLYRTAAAGEAEAARGTERAVALLANSRMKRRNLKEAYRKLQEAYNLRCRELDNYIAESIANG